MRRHRVLLVAAATGARQTVADRSGLAVLGCFEVLVLLAIGSLWRVAAGANGGEVAGYSAVALVWYVACSEAAGLAMPATLIERVGAEIDDGSVTDELLRPASVLGVRLAVEVGRAGPRMATCAAVGVVVATAMVGAPPDALGVVLAVPALALAVPANVAAQHVVAALSFRVRRVRSLWFLYQKLVFILGGMLIPLEVLPAGLAAVARWLPFAAFAYVPGRLASGHLEPGWLAVQAGWLVAAVLVARAAFGAGLDRLVETGG